MALPKTKPLISVVMPVHNALPYLDEGGSTHFAPDSARLRVRDLR
jgi:hypothetical protein